MTPGTEVVADEPGNRAIIEDDTTTGIVKPIVRTKGPWLTPMSALPSWSPRRYQSPGTSLYRTRWAYPS